MEEKMRARTPQYPRAVEAKRGGKIEQWATYTILKELAMPNLAKRTSKKNVQ